MLMLGKSLLDLQKVEDVEEIYTQINNITAIELQDIANEMFNEQSLSMLTFLPKL